MPAPSFLLTPKPTPTPRAITNRPISSLAIILLRLLSLARHWHECLLILAALAFFFQCAWPGHTWPSAQPLRLLLLVLFMPQESSPPVRVRLEIMASRSVSKGLASCWAVAGVETAEGRSSPAKEPAGDTARVSAEAVDLRSFEAGVTVVRDRPVFSPGAAIVLLVYVFVVGTATGRRVDVDGAMQVCRTRFCAVGGRGVCGPARLERSGLSILLLAKRKKKNCQALGPC